MCATSIIINCKTIWVTYSTTFKTKHVNCTMRAWAGLGEAPEGSIKNKIHGWNVVVTMPTWDTADLPYCMSYTEDYTHDQVIFRLFFEIFIPEEDRQTSVSSARSAQSVRASAS